MSDHQNLEEPEQLHIQKQPTFNIESTDIKGPESFSPELQSVKEIKHPKQLTYDEFKSETGNHKK